MTVSMTDYQNLGGGFRGGFGGLKDMGPLFGMNVEEFKKALGANYQSPRMDGSAALRVESLEQTLRIITWQNKHLKLWYDIAKGPAYSTVHEFDVQTSYGVENGGFTNAGEAPQVQDSAYRRAAVLIKYLTTQREVDHPTSLVRSAHGNVIAMQTRDGALWLMRMAEKALFFGRADVIPQEFDGFDQLIRSDTTFGQNNIMDMRGGPLTYDAVASGINTIELNYGQGSDLYLSPTAIVDLVKQEQIKTRIVYPAPSEGVIGVSVNKIRVGDTDVELKKDIFLRPAGDNGNKKAPASANAVRAPAAPSAFVASAAAGISSQFTAGDVGTYQYKATAINRFGESAFIQETGGQAVSSAGDGVSLLITDGGGEAATGYKIYRSRVGGAAGTEELIMRVPRAGATTTVVDVNRFLPGCSRSYLFSMTEEVMGVVQLAPMFKVPFATQALSLRWAQGMYLAPILRAPGKCFIFDNVRDE